MSNSTVQIVKCYAHNGGPGGHISVTDDGRAVLVCPLGEGDFPAKVFEGSSDETAEVQAQNYVHENFDKDAEFFDDSYLDLITWILQDNEVKKVL